MWLTGADSPRGFENLSPFELKDELIATRRTTRRTSRRRNKFLNAGRGNPNWIATTPREAFFLLGQFALEESKRVWDEPDLGGMPHADGHRGAASRVSSIAAPQTTEPTLLRRALDYGVSELGFEADAFVHELVDSIVGDNYPEPDRMLVHAEQVVARYLEQDDVRRATRRRRAFDLFAVEGAPRRCVTCSSSLIANRILHRATHRARHADLHAVPRDAAARATSSFKTIEIGQSEMATGMPHLAVPGRGDRASWRIPKVKAFFIVNPSNPASFAMRDETHGELVELVRTKRPDLIILTDDVYGTFAEASARSRPTCRTTRSSSTRTRSTSAAPAGASASSRCTRTTSSTR